MDDKILSERTYGSSSMETTARRDEPHTPNTKVTDVTTLSTALPKHVKYLQEIAYMRSGDKGNTANIGEQLCNDMTVINDIINRSCLS